MPIKNIIPGQRVAKEKLGRAREFRRDMTPTEAILWQELRGTSWEFILEDSRLSQVLLSISIVTRQVWLSSWTVVSIKELNRRKMTPNGMRY